MKPRITVLTILFVLFNIVPSNALDEKANRNQIPQQFSGRELNHQLPPGFIDMNEGVVPKFMKKGDKIQSNDGYLVESIKAYRTYGPVKNYSYTYNENKQVLIELLLWLPDGYDNRARHTSTYDENGNLLTYLNERWSSYQWENYTRDSYTYDENGNQLTYLNEIWEYWDSKEWVNKNRNTYSYDENGNLLTYLSERWESADSINYEWIGNVKFTYSYDENGNRLTFLYEEWYGRWVILKKRTYTYDVYGNSIKELIEHWQIDKWVDFWRYTSSYDENGNRLTWLSEFLEYFEWVIEWRYIFTYDKDGNRSTYLQEMWENGEWVNSTRLFYTYDENNNLLIELTEDWTNDQWENFRKKTFTYDENGNLLKRVCEKWQTNKWVGNDLSFTFEDTYGNSYGNFQGYFTEITWRNASSVENKSEDNLSLTVSPNPFNQFTIINYELRNPGNVTLNIYDILGNEITTLVNEYQTAGGHSSLFKAKNLPTGVYYYTIRIGEWVENGKLLLTR